MFLQWLVNWHGKEILDAIEKHTEELSLTLDNYEVPSQPSSVPRPKVDGKFDSSRGDAAKISPAKEEAWKMWQEQGLSFFAIAVSPNSKDYFFDRSAVRWVLCHFVTHGRLGTCHSRVLECSKQI